MDIAYFFRKNQSGRFSIERVFNTIQKAVDSDLVTYRFTMKYHTGSIGRLINVVYCLGRQKDINHITGDIHYVACFLKRNRTVLTIHDIEVLNRAKSVKRYFIKLLWYTLPCKMVQYITVISSFTKAELIKNVGVDPEKIIVIPNPVSEQIKYRPKEHFNEIPIILQIGTKRNKNLDNLILALKEVTCCLWILGKIDARQKYNLEAAGIDYRVFENVTYKKVLELYETCDLVTLVSTYEGFGLPIIEANGVGRPVVTSDVSSMPEVANDAALLVDPYSVQSIKSGILKVINTPSLRDQLVQKGIKNVRRFSIETISKQYINIYNKIQAD
jgi:glycosyltransferase involved in cell wall biosynthesis